MTRHSSRPEVAGGRLPAGAIIVGRPEQQRMMAHVRDGTRGWRCAPG